MTITKLFQAVEKREYAKIYNGVRSGNDKFPLHFI